MKINCKRVNRNYLAVVTILTVISLIFQSNGPFTQTVSAKGLDQNSESSSRTNISTISRPNLEQKIGIPGLRHIFDENSDPSLSNSISSSTAKVIPIVFIENTGQFSKKEVFEARTNNSIIRINENSLWFTLIEPNSGNLLTSEDLVVNNDEKIKDKHLKGVNIKIDFIGANSKTSIKGIEKANSKFSYFFGSDAGNWQSNVPVWDQIRYEDLYPGVDLQVSGNNGKWEWKFVVKDSSQLKQWYTNQKNNEIGLQFLGIKSNKISTSQLLELNTEIGDVYLPNIEITWADDNPLDIEVPEYQFDGNKLVLLSNESFLAQLPSSTPSETIQPDITQTGEISPTPTMAPITSTPIIEPTETFTPTEEENPTEIPTNSSTPPEDYSLTSPNTSIEELLNSESRETNLTTSNNIQDQNNSTTFVDEQSTEIQITPTPTETPSQIPTETIPYLESTNTEIPSITPTEAFPTIEETNTETPNATIEPTEIPNIEETPTVSFETKYTWNFSKSRLQDSSPETMALSSSSIFSTYLGGNGLDQIFDIYADSEGFVYATGMTNSLEFPTTPGAFQTTIQSAEAFISKLNLDGSGLIYSTFLGGEINGGNADNLDEGRGISVDSGGFAYITGRTNSSSFPTTSGVIHPTGSGNDAFVTKINEDGTALVYSTYLGGIAGTEGHDITINSSGQAYIVGLTANSSFPTTLGAYSRVFGGAYDGYIVELNSNGSALVFSTFLGGSNTDCEVGSNQQECSVFLDSDNNVYIVGNTTSSNFPTTNNAYDRTYNGSSDEFVAEVDPTGANLLYSTYLGGSSTEGFGASHGAVDSFGAIYITGTTQSSNFPITQGTFHGGTDVFITKLYPDDRGIVYSTLLGGTNNDYGWSIAITPNGDAYLTGSTFSSNFPITQNSFQSTLHGTSDAFITKVGPDGSTLSYSTFLGGVGDEVAFAVSRSENSSIYVAGYTSSSDFPTTTGVLKPTGGNDAFITQFTLESSVQDNSTYSSCGGTKNLSTGSSDSRECPTFGISQGKAGDPINTRTGGLDVSFSDLSLSTVAGDLVFERFYSSSAINSFTQPLGPGWTHNQDTRLIFSTDFGGNPDGILFKAHSLNTYLFYDNGDGTYTPEAGVTSSLIKHMGSSTWYTISDKSQHIYTFDENGKLTLWEDGHGHSWSYTYDAEDRLYRVTDDTSLNYLEFTYTTEGYLSEVADNNGRSVSYDYDTSNDLVSITDVSSQVWTLTYDSSHHLRLLVNPSNTTIIHTEYDTQGRAYQQYDGENNLVLEITYNQDGTRLITDGNGNDITHTYDKRNTLLSTENSLNGFKQKAYDDNFNLTLQTDENGNSVSTQWSTDGKNLLVLKDAEENQTDLFYDDLNNLESITDPYGASTSYDYSGTLLTSVTDALQQTTHYTYTDVSDWPAPVGLVKTVEDALGRITIYSYNNLGQVTSVTDALNQRTEYTYDTWGNVKRTYYPISGRQDWSCYNAAGQLNKTIRNASGGWDSWLYEPCSDQYRPVTGDVSLDRTTEYYYDLSGNNIAVKGEDGIITRNYYNENNHIITSVYNLTSYSIDNPTPPAFDENYPSTNIRTDYVYDTNGNQIASIDTLGKINRTYYDTENRPEFVVENLTDQDIAVQTPPTYNSSHPDQNVRTQTIYDLAGNQIAIIEANGIITRTYYDKNNRPISIVKNLTGQTIETVTAPTYNSATPDQNIRTDTVYDANGNVIATVDTLGRITRTYYTALNQVATVVQNLVNQSIETSTPPTYNAAYPDQNIRTDYEYDAVGNQIAVVDPMGIITRTYYDALNRQIAVVQNLQGQSIETSTPPAYNPTYPDQNVRTETSYNSLGFVRAATDPNGIITWNYLGRTGITFTKVYNLVGQSIDSTSPPTYDPAYPDRNVQTQYAYYQNGDLGIQIDNSGQGTWYYYDFAHHQTIFDKSIAGQTIRSYTTYDGLGNGFKTTDPDGKVNYSCYDGMGRIVKSVENPSVLDPCVEYTPTSQSDRDIITKYSFDAVGNLLNSTNPLSKTTSYEYDDLGRRTKVTDALLHQTQYTYDGLGNQVMVLDANNVSTRYEYDDLNRLTAVVENYLSGTAADAQTNIRTEYTYDANGNLKSIKNGNNKTTLFTYDSLNRQKTETDPLNHTTTFNYDAAGNLLSKIDANGYTITYAYDNLSRNTAVNNPGSDADVSYTYNDAGYRATMTDGLGTTHWNYDGIGRTTSVIDPNNQTIGYQYDESGNRVGITYPGSKQVNYTYDSANRLATVTSWDTSVTSYTYDRNGQLDLVNLPNSIWTDYTYNDVGYLTQKINKVNSSTLSSFGYTYDNVGNRSSAAETTVLAVTNPGSDALFSDSFESASLSKWSRANTDSGNLSVTTQAAMTGSYGMSALINDNNSIYVVDWSPNSETRYKASFKFDMNTITMATNDAHYIFYGYNSSGTGMVRVGFQKVKKGYQIDVETLTDSSWTNSSWYTVTDAPHTIQFEWKAAPTSTTHNGSLQLWIDGVSKQTLSNLDNDTIRLSSAKLGAVEGIDTGTRGTEFFDDFNSYRSQAWVTGESATRTVTYNYDPLNRLTSANGSDGELFQYTYDAVGNRLTETTTGGITANYAYDDANRLINVNGVSYTWDANGNLLSDGTTTYNYNHSNQLTGVSQGGINYSYVYDGNGNRLRQTVGTTVTNYLLDTVGGLSQVLADSTNTYLYGLERISQSSAGSKEYFLGDALSSVRQLANTTGAITLSRNFEPYGTLYGSMGTATTAYGFTDEWTDGNGLVNLRARYYNTITGRFVSKDSWRGDFGNPITLTKWLYASANPILFTDQSGKCNDQEYQYFDTDRNFGIHVPNFPIHPPEIITNVSFLHLSPKGEAFIKDRELLRVWPYDDTTGTCTIGYGTELSYPEIANCSKDQVQSRKDYYVRDETSNTLRKMDPTDGLKGVYIEEYFHNEIVEDERKISESIHIILLQNQFDALVSFLYNTGSNKLANKRDINGISTTYAYLINHNRASEAFTEMIRMSSFSKNGVFYQVLYDRRYEEMEMYFLNDYN